MIEKFFLLATEYPMPTTLILLMASDIATGLMVAFVTKTVSSSTSLKGMCKKITMLIFIGLCAAIDPFIPPVPLGHGGEVVYLPLVKIAALCYIVSELLSVMENMAVLGVPLPSMIVDALIQVKASKQLSPLIVPAPAASIVEIQTSGSVNISPPANVESTDASGHKTSQKIS